VIGFWPDLEPVNLVAATGYFTLIEDED